MENKRISNELRKIASEVKDFDEKMSSDLQEMSKYVKLLENEEVYNRHFNIFTAAQDIATASIEKEAKLINESDVVICVDNFQPLFKGRRYVVSDASIPGYLRVCELDGADVGVFAINRFVLDYNEQ